MSEGSENAVTNFSRTEFLNLDLIDILSWVLPVMRSLGIIRCLAILLASIH